MKGQRVALIEEGSVFIKDANGKLQQVIVADSNLSGSASAAEKLKHYTTKAEFEAALAKKADQTEVDKKANQTEVDKKADKSEVDASLLQKADKASLINYATKVDLEGKVDSTTLASLLALKADKTQVEGFATKAEIAGFADRSTVNAELAKKANASEVNTALNQKANKSDLSAFYTKDQVDTKVSKNLADVQGLVADKASKDDLSKKLDKDALDGYYTKPQTDALLDKKLDKTEFSAAMQGKADVSDLTGLATEEYVNAQVGQKADKGDLSSFYTKGQVDDKLAGYAKTGDLQAGLATKLNTNALSGYATEQYVDQKINSIDFVDQTALQNAIAPLATKVYVDTKLNTKLGPNDIKGLATTDYVDQQIGAAVKVDTSRFASTEYVDNKTTGLATVQYVNEQTRDKASKDDLNTKADKDSLKAYYTKENVDDKLSGKLDTATFQIEIVRKADKSDLTPLATKTEVAQGLGLKADKTDLQGLITAEYVDQRVEGLVTDQELQSGLEGKLNNNALDPYYNKEQVDALISGLASKAQIDELEGKKLDANVLVTTLQNGYYDKREIDRKLAGIDVGSGSGGTGTGSGSAFLTSDIQVTNVVGNASGTMTSGTALEDVLFKMLTKTSYPTLTPPSASITGVNTTTAKVGTNVTGLNVRVSLNRGTINPTYGTNGYRAGAATGYNIAVSGANVNHTDSNSNGVFTLPAITRSTRGTAIITGTAKYGAGQQPKDSEGNNYQSPLSAGQVTATAQINFIVPFIYGAVQNQEFSKFSDWDRKTEDLTAKGTKSYTFSTNNQFAILAFDASYGNIAMIKDSNNFNLTDSWTQKVMTIDGIQYNVYMQNTRTTDVSAQFTFSF